MKHCRIKSRMIENNNLPNIAMHVITFPTHAVIALIIRLPTISYCYFEAAGHFSCTRRMQIKIIRSSRDRIRKTNIISMRIV